MNKNSKAPRKSVELKVSVRLTMAEVKFLLKSADLALQYQLTDNFTLVAQITGKLTQAMGDFRSPFRPMSP